MPILAFSMRSQDLDNPIDHQTQTAIKTINLQKPFKMKYLKLLHIYHNISFTNIHDSTDVSQASNTILFAKLSFLNGQNAVFYESSSNETKEHLGMICLGETIPDPHKVTFRDTYKVLHSKGILFLNQPFTVQLFQLRTIDTSTGNTNVATYNDSGSHEIVPITCSQFRGPLDSGGQSISFVFEYDEDQSK